MVGMRIVALSGGVGGARYLLGVRSVARDIGADVTAIVNVGDDVTLHGLRICPDLDSVMYALGGGADPERGWGRTDESWKVKDELAAYGAQPDWFGLGDRDLATHLIRTKLLNQGQSLTEVTQVLGNRWQPGMEVLPATDDVMETHAVVDLDGETVALHFQEWWVRYRGDVPTKRFVVVGAESARPPQRALEAIADADVVLVAPSNPIVSISPILAVRPLTEAIVNAKAPVVGVSPIIGGSPVRGMADKCLAIAGVECTAEGVGRLMGARSEGKLLDGWLVDSTDEGVAVPGVEVRSRPLWMTDEAATAAIVREALNMAGVL
jgi:LPPG:FO 2-phospho-L-lactate transferase